MSTTLSPPEARTLRTIVQNPDTYMAYMGGHLRTYLPSITATLLAKGLIVKDGLNYKATDEGRDVVNRMPPATWADVVDPDLGW